MDENVIDRCPEHESHFSEYKQWPEQWDLSRTDISLP